MRLWIALRTVQTVNVKSPTSVRVFLAGLVPIARFQSAQAAQQMENVLDQIFAPVKKDIPELTVLFQSKPDQTTA